VHGDGGDAARSGATDVTTGASRWLVDGMNVIGSRPTGWWRDRRGAMRELVAELERFAVATGAEVAVVFDGRPFELPSRHVEVAFARRSGRDAADDEIARRVAADEDPASLAVATSDSGLASRVREHGAQVVGGGSFRDRLDAAAPD
jgi:predicted RNA-binding protein with PIN domain